MTNDRQNNFDLIRLFAATQVVLVHGAENVVTSAPYFAVDLLNRFPGVPIFFIISGFLISKSFESHPSVANYFRNRALRIYPALYVCLALSILSASTYLAHVAIPPTQLFEWLFAQLTVFQFLRAPFFYGYATGTLNGSLWTIPIELQFYLALPILYFALAGRRGRTIWLVALAAAFVAFNVYSYDPDVAASNTFDARLLKMSLAPYLYMFLLGMLAQENIRALSPFVRGKFLWWLGAYLALSYLSSAIGLRATENQIGPLSVVTLCGVVLSAAFSAPRLSKKLLRGNDYSYGIYIYHMPVANALIYLSIGKPWERYAFMIAATGLLAALSWHFVEAPALRLKRDALRPIQSV